jgi:CBS domain-containing protein
MTATQTDIKTETLRLATDAFEAFCADIQGMFGIEIKCQAKEQQGGNAGSLQKRFKKLCAVNRVRGQGALDGNFYLLLGQEALFTMAGIFVMQPEKQIIENRKFGTEQQAQAMGDPIKEAGNLLVGAWDKVFRENMPEHKHFLQTGTFISNTWHDTEKHISLAKDDMLSACFYELTAGGFPPFECCVVFPDDIFIPKPQENPVEAETQKKPEVAEPVKVEEVVQPPAEPAKANEVVQNNAVENSQKQPQQPEVSIPADSEKVKVFQILDLKALDIMNSDIKWCDPGCTIEKAMEQMQQTRADYLLVGSEQKAQGIVAMSDLSAAVSIYLRPMFSKWKRELDDATLRIKVQAIMSKPIRSIPPDTPLDVVAEKIVRLGGCLVVMDTNGKTLGIITSKDFITRLLR